MKNKKAALKRKEQP